MKKKLVLCLTACFAVMERGQKTIKNHTYKKPLSIIVFTTLFSYLFYNQNIGINATIFSVLFLILLFFLFKEQFKRTAVLLVGAAMIVSSIGCLLHGSDFAIWATAISALVLIGFVHGKNTIFYSIITSFLSLVGSLIFVIVDKKESAQKRPFQVLSFIIPLLLIFIFFSIYRQINPLFEELTKDYTLNNISGSWLLLTFAGLLLIVSVFYHKSISSIDQFINKQTNHITKGNFKDTKWDESLALIILFTALNIMLVAVNSMDVNYLYLGAGLPEGVTHKMFVHKGVGMLIFSIFLGISILLYFFRGKLNFEKNSKLAKALALIWVAQNVFMVISTTLRNNIYVCDALLSYKRLGVYFWLAFAFIGLIITAIKLIKNKTTWFLIQKNSIAVFSIFILSTLVNWDSLISNFNLRRANEMTDISPIDKHYLLSLSESNIASMYGQAHKTGFEFDPDYSYIMNFDGSNRNYLDMKLFNFLEDEYSSNWQSFSFMRKKVAADLKELFEKQNIQTINLTNATIKSLAPLYGFTGIKSVVLDSTYFRDLPSLNHFHFQSISLDNNYIKDLDTLVSNQNLITLSLNNNQFASLRFLNLFPNLDTLKVKENELMQFSSIPDNHTLKYLAIDGNPVNDISDLKSLKELEYLSANNLHDNAGKLPYFSKLKSFYANNSDFFVKYALNTEYSYNTVKNLSLSGNEFQNLKSLFCNNSTPRFPSVSNLSLKDNKISDIPDLRYFPELTYLVLSYNPIVNIDGLQNLDKLQVLSLEACNITDISPLEGLIALKVLSLSANNSISNFKSLHHLINLKKLDLSHTEFSDLTDITNLSNLKYLNISKCHITNMEEIQKIQSIENLKISYLKEKDITYLKGLKNLKQLTLSNCENTTKEIVKKELKKVRVFIDG